MDGFRRAAITYLNELVRKGYAEKTIENYAYALVRAHSALSENGRPPTPPYLTDAHMTLLQASLARDPWLLRTLSVCLKSMGSPVRLEYDIPPRTRVDWLSKEDANRAFETARSMGSPYYMLVTLELLMGYRRISVMRSRMGDFNGMSVLVHGKGHDYVIPPAPNLQDAMRDTVCWRKEQRLNDCDILIPTKRLSPYSESGMNGLLKRVSVESGIKFSHHTLRRTCGRSLWKAGVPIETVCRLLGQKDVQVTMDYLGINLSDMQDAMNRLEMFLRTAEVSSAMR